MIKRFRIDPYLIEFQLKENHFLKRTCLSNLKTSLSVFHSNNCIEAKTTMNIEQCNEYSNLCV